MSKVTDAIRAAAAKGYSVTVEGEVLNRLGKKRKLQIKRRGPYLLYVFNIGWDDGSFPIPVHRLAAFLKFGEPALVERVQTRHLDGDSLNNRPGNIDLGSGTDNAMDRLPADRQAHAQKAGRAASRHTDETWAAVRADYALGMGYKKLRTKYGIPLGTLSYNLSKTGAKVQLANR